MFIAFTEDRMRILMDFLFYRPPSNPRRLLTEVLMEYLHLDNQSLLSQQTTLSISVKARLWQMDCKSREDPVTAFVSLLTRLPSWKVLTSASYGRYSFKTEHGVFHHRISRTCFSCPCGKHNFCNHCSDDQFCCWLFHQCTSNLLLCSPRTIQWQGCGTYS